MTNDLISRIPAETMARVYQENLPKIQAAVLAIGECCQALQQVFDDRYNFRLDLELHQARYAWDQEACEAIADRFKRAAWGALINKLGIRKLMSSKRAGELDAATSAQERWRYRSEETQGDELPEITPETLYDVLAGMVSSADEFMQEAIHEEYDFWKPTETTAYKTNSGPFALGRKVIKTWMVDWGLGGSRFAPTHGNRKHLIALDNIFHRLDGQGVPAGYAGPLVDGINTCGADGRGETEFFRFRCFKNGNLHLWFKRLDLLEKFNERAGRNRLPAAKTA
jgi:hypothetical protein